MLEPLSPTHLRDMSQKAITFSLKLLTDGFDVLFDADEPQRFVAIARETRAESTVPLFYVTSVGAAVDLDVLGLEGLATRSVLRYVV